MEPKQERKWELRAVSVVLAVIIALMGFSAALATKPQSDAPAATETSAASTYQDPSLSGLGVADDAEADGTVLIFN